MIRWAIWYHLYNLKNVKNTHGGVLILVKLMVKVVRYLPKSEAVVHMCLQSFAEKRLFMSIFFTKVAGLQPKKKSARDVFL